jgi:hypothetical protein
MSNENLLLISTFPTSNIGLRERIVEKNFYKRINQMRLFYIDYEHNVEFRL